MNLAASEPEGSTQEPASNIDPNASHHWVCGMPLSWVLETTSRWLNNSEQPALLAGLPDPATLDSAAE
jgi:hypothetical protein